MLHMLLEKERKWRDPSVPASTFLIVLIERSDGEVNNLYSVCFVSLSTIQFDRFSLLNWRPDRILVEKYFTAKNIAEGV